MQVTGLHPDLLNKKLQGPLQMQVFLKGCPGDSEVVTGLEAIASTRWKEVETCMN